MSTKSITLIPDDFNKTIRVCINASVSDNKLVPDTDSLEVTVDGAVRTINGMTSPTTPVVASANASEISSQSTTEDEVGITFDKILDDTITVSNKSNSEILNSLLSLDLKLIIGKIDNIENKSDNEKLYLDILYILWFEKAVGVFDNNIFKELNAQRVQSMLGINDLNSYTEILKLKNSFNKYVPNITDLNTISSSFKPDAKETRITPYILVNIIHSLMSANENKQGQNGGKVFYTDFQKVKDAYDNVINKYFGNDSSDFVLIEKIARTDKLNDALTDILTYLNTNKNNDGVIAQEIVYLAISLQLLKNNPKLIGDNTEMTNELPQVLKAIVDSNTDKYTNTKNVPGQLILTADKINEIKKGLNKVIQHVNTDTHVNTGAAVNEFNTIKSKLNKVNTVVKTGVNVGNVVDNKHTDNKHTINTGGRRITKKAPKKRVTRRRRNIGRRRKTAKK